MIVQIVLQSPGCTVEETGWEEKLTVDEIQNQKEDEEISETRETMDLDGDSDSDPEEESSALTRRPNIRHFEAKVDEVFFSRVIILVINTTCRVIREVVGARKTKRFLLKLSLLRFLFIRQKRFLLSFSGFRGFSRFV